MAAELARKKLKEMQAEYANRADKAAENVKEFFEGLEDEEGLRMAADVANTAPLSHGGDDMPQGWEVMSW